MTDPRPWYTLETLRADWKEAPSNDSVLQQLIDAAKQEVLTYDNGWNYRRNPDSYDENEELIPWSGDYYPAPSQLMMAQRMQARNLWNSARVDPSNAGMGDDTFMIRPFPLDWVVKQVIRPKSPVGRFG